MKLGTLAHVDVGLTIGLLVGAVYGLAALTIALAYRDRADARHHDERREMLSRIQHPDLVSHKAALDWEVPPQEPSALDQPELAMAGRVFEGEDEDDGAPTPDPRLS